MKCGRRCDGEYGEVVEPQAFKVRGREVTVPVSLMKCDACGDIMYSPEQMDRAQKAVYAEIRRRENLLAPEEIASLRLCLGLKQEEFERLLGLGPKTVVRWESGRVFQSKAADALMRLVQADRANAVRLADWNGITLPYNPPLRRTLGRRSRSAP
ncbi:MAG TPA: type II TA system antitoxin MqsA family protein [Longimicrobium sp.]|nr:type II TA system antitoxin MqsA family protein [Longimicrobium sp.]